MPNFVVRAASVFFLARLTFNRTTNKPNKPSNTKWNARNHRRVTQPVLLFQTQSLPVWRAVINNVVVFVVTTSLVASAWCGVWTLMDAWIFPRHLLCSYAASLASGSGLAVVLIALRQYAWWRCRRGCGWQGAIATRCACGLATAVNMLLWRGGWGIMQTFVLAGDEVWRCWACHVLGVVYLLVCWIRNNCIRGSFFMSSYEVLFFYYKAIDT